MRRTPSFVCFVNDSALLEEENTFSVELYHDTDGRREREREAVIENEDRSKAGIKRIIRLKAYKFCYGQV